MAPVVVHDHQPQLAVVRLGVRAEEEVVVQPRLLARVHVEKRALDTRDEILRCHTCTLNCLQPGQFSRCPALARLYQAAEPRHCALCAAGSGQCPSVDTFYIHVEIRY